MDGLGTERFRSQALRKEGFPFFWVEVTLGSDSHPRTMRIDDLLLTGDQELRDLIDRAKRLGRAERDMIARDPGLLEAYMLSPSCGAEMSENVAGIKEKLKAYLARFERKWSRRARARS